MLVPMEAVGKAISVAIDNATHPNLDLEMLRAHCAPKHQHHHDV